MKQSYRVYSGYLEQGYDIAVKQIQLRISGNTYSLLCNEYSQIRWKNPTKCTVLFAIYRLNK